MGINLVTNFSVGVPSPLDDRDVVADIAARDAIAAGVRYPGMGVHVIDSDGFGLVKNYQLVGGITNSDWDEFAGGGSGGISEWVDATVYALDAQVVFENSIYKCTTAHTSSAAFITDIANWTKILSYDTVVTSVVGDRTADYSDDVLLVDCSAFNATITITLPAAVDAKKILTIKRIDNTAYDVIIIRAGADLIDGETSITLFRQYDSIRLVGTSTLWSVI